MEVKMYQLVTCFKSCLVLYYTHLIFSAHGAGSLLCCSFWGFFRVFFFCCSVKKFVSGNQTRFIAKYAFKHNQDFFFSCCYGRRVLFMYTPGLHDSSFFSTLKSNWLDTIYQQRVKQWMQRWKGLHEFMCCSHLFSYGHRHTSPLGGGSWWISVYGRKLARNKEFNQLRTILLPL